MGRGQPLSLSQFFDGDPGGRALFDAVASTVDALGDHDVRVTKSQIAFRRRRSFAFVWRPDRYVTSDVPAVLSIALPYRLEADRFKEIAHPTAAVWMHHLELNDAGDIDDEVRNWLAVAYEEAG